MKTIPGAKEVVSMRFGLFNLLQHPDAAKRPDVYRDELERQLEQMEYAEELGFHSVWLAEHHFSEYGMMSDAMLLAAHLAARTRRIRIGIAVTVLPFNNPVRLAEQTAAVDCLSRGRFIQGVGRGYQPAEFAGFGIAMEESRARFEEGLDVMIKALSQSSFHHKGRFYHYPEISIYPKPMQKPHPPLYIASVSDETIVSTAKKRLPMLTGQVFLPFEKTLEKVQLYQKALQESGVAQPEIERLTRDSFFQRFIYVAETNEQSKRDAQTALMNYIKVLTKATLPPFASKLPATYTDYRRRAEDRTKLTFDQMWEETLIFGDPDRCAKRIRELRGMGVNSLLCWMVFGGLEHAKVLRSMELFAKHVMPQFQERPAALAV